MAEHIEYMCTCACSVLSDSLGPHGLYSLPGSSVHGFSQYWSGVPFPPPGDRPTQGLNPWLLHWQANSLTLSYLGNPWGYIPNAYLGNCFEEKLDVLEDLTRRQLRAVCSPSMHHDSISHLTCVTQWKWAPWLPLRGEKGWQASAWITPALLTTAATTYCF